MSLLVRLSPQPAPGEVPRRFVDPFAPVPHPLAQRAATSLRQQLARGDVALPEGAGKMFGVLVVRDAAGQLGYLKAFSGLLADRWDVPGFVPGTWDAEEKERVWEPRVRVLKALSAQIDALAQGPEAAAREAAQTYAAERQQTVDALRAARAANRVARAEQRSQSGGAAGVMTMMAEASHAECRAEREARRALAAREAELRARLEEIVAERRCLERRRKDLCNEALRAVLDTYVLQNALGTRKPLREIFAPRKVPGGAGDCAAPKLLFHAFRHALQPLALAEFWWGAPAKAGDRVEGAFYPACEGKCGTVLPFMLEGIEVERACPPVNTR